MPRPALEVFDCLGYTYRKGMESVFLIVAILATLVTAFFVLPRWKARRAMRQVIETFRRFGATDPSSAMTPEELGLTQQSGGWLPTIRAKDYRQYALLMLTEAQIIKQLQNGKLYLLEEKLPLLRDR